MGDALFQSSAGKYQRIEVDGEAAKGRDGFLNAVNPGLLNFAAR